MTRTIVLALFLASALSAQEESAPAWKARMLAAANTPESWKARQQVIRRQILVATGLWPEFERPALKPEIFGKVEGEGYTIERVQFETWPGFYLTGSLYRPAGRSGPFPGIVSPHGHWQQGRFTQTKDGNLPARGITFARLGFVCFMYDMVGYADSKQLPHKFEDPAWGVGLMGVQTYNSLRAVDFLTSLPDVDPKRIGCTGASGGGTQTFILTAVDDRIACSAPVNMVAAEFQGGCTCENAPFLRLNLNNVEIAAAAAPRPLLLVAATGDWTKNVPTLEGPAVRGVYKSLKVEANFRFVQFNAPHNYNKDSREAVYAWMARWLQNGPDQEKVEEPAVPEVKKEDLTVFAGDHKLPQSAVDSDGLKKSIREMIAKQLAALAPRDANTLKKFRDSIGGAIPSLLGAVWEKKEPRELQTIIVCTKAEEAEAYAKSAENPVEIVVLKPHERETPAGGDKGQTKAYPTCFYRTAFAWQVGDAVEALLRARPKGAGLTLIGAGDAGLATLFARSVVSGGVRVGKTVIDLSSVPEDESYHPSMLRIGGWRSAAMMADPGVLVLHGKAFDASAIRAAYRAAGREGALVVSEERITGVPR